MGHDPLIIRRGGATRRRLLCGLALSLLGLLLLAAPALARSSVARGASIRASTAACSTTTQFCITLGLSPAFIPAQLGSTSAATASVTDASGTPDTTDTVSFTSSDPNVVVVPSQVANAPYSVTIASTVSTPEQVTITASESDGGSSVQTVLTLYGTAAAVSSVTTAPSSIVADGTSQITATAAVSDAAGLGVPKESVSFTTSDPSVVPVSAVTDNGDGTYSQTFQSSTTAGIVTVTAQDGSLTNSTTFLQTAGPAAHISVQLNPTSVPANGSSLVQVVATVTDAFNNPVDGDAVGFVSSDVGDLVSGTTPTGGGSGAYTATITSSTSRGTPLITATDQTTGVSSQTILSQTAGPSTTLLTVPPGNPRTNQNDTLVATVQATSFGSPNGTVSFDDGGTPISGCDAVTLSPNGSVATALCQTSFAASGSPAKLTAVYSGAGNVAGSTSTEMDLGVGVDGTGTVLTSSASQPSVDTKVTYTATVTTGHSGPVTPSGTVVFDDGAKAISSCMSQTVSTANGTSTAKCTVTYVKAGSHTIVAHYSGDNNFYHSTSTQLTIKVPAPTLIPAGLGWTFHYTPTYTTVDALLAQALPSSGKVVVICHGQGCPFIKRTLVPGKVKRCTGKGSKRKCTTMQLHSVDLYPVFRRHRLHVGTKLIVELVGPGWVAKYFRFTMLSRAAPATFSSCLAPNGTKPGVGCSLS